MKGDTWILVSRVAAGLLWGLAGCGGQALPTCPAGQALGTDAEGQLVCRAAPQSPLTLTPCPRDTLLNSDGLTLRCAPVAPTGATAADLQAREARRLLDEQTASMQLGRVAGRQRPLYVGTTLSKSPGRLLFIVPNSDSGFDAGTRACAAVYGSGARMCTAYDLYASVAAGRFGNGVLLPRSWVYFPTLARFTRTQEPDAGLADNCASYTYPTSDHGWNGVVGEWAPLPSGVDGLVLHGDSDARCHLSLPIACCK